MDFLGPGTVLANDFLLTGSLARGGFSSIYRAQQLSTGQPCVIKTMAVSHPDRDGEQRAFLQEPRLLIRAPSEHMVRVINLGAQRAGETTWFAMEYLDGEPLDSHLSREEYLEPGEAVSLLHQVCVALEAAHKRGITHCDVNPSNIFIARASGGNSTLKLLDFAIAKWAQWPSDPFESKVVGTPAYAAPEQLQSRDLVSPATDVWALGLVAFEMLTGRRYWEAPDNRALLQETLTGEIVSASQRAEQLHAPVRLPAGFDKWFAKCVTRDLSERFPSAWEARQALHWFDSAEVVRPIWSVALQEAPLGEIASVLGYLKAVSGDPTLVLKRVTRGSVVLLIEGARKAYDKARSLFEERKLLDVFDQPIIDIQWRGGAAAEEIAGGRLPAATPSSAGIQAFISYAPEDDHLCDELLIHLAMMRRQGILQEWYDRRVIPGTTQNDEIHKALDGSRIFLPLVSAHYLASDYCFDVEMRRALEKHQNGDAQIIPVIVRACDWNHPPLGLLQALPTDARPVTSWPNRDEAWLDVTRGIRRAVESPPAR